MKFTCIALALVTVAACKGGSTGKTADLSLFAKPEPPGDLAKVKYGMTQADVKALFKDAHPTPNHSGSPSLTTESGYKNVDYRIQFYGDIDQVASVEAELLDKLDVAGQAKKLWGAPVEESAAFGPTWLSPDGAWEINIMEMGRRTEVQYKPFTPFDKTYLGDKPGLFGQLAKLHWGMSKAEITAAVPKLEPAPKNGSYIPFEAGPRGVRLTPYMDDADEKLERIEVDLPKNGEETLTKVWGAPQTGKGGGDPCKAWDSPDKATRIVLGSGGFSGARATLTPPAKAFCTLPGDAPSP
ncbi:MAG TPA: hypothetical protein VGM90_10590 [Kofleriaceae bacterium]